MAVPGTGPGKGGLGQGFAWLPRCNLSDKLIRFLRGGRGGRLSFSCSETVREFGIFSARLVTSSEFGGVENVTRYNYKLAFQTGWEVPCFVLLLQVVALSIQGDRGMWQ